MLYSIIIMLKRTSGVVRWVNKNALDLAGKFLLKRFQREQVVAKNQLVVEKVVVRHAVLRVIRFRRVFQQNARLKLGSVLLPNPRQFQFLFARHTHVIAGGGTAGEAGVAGAD